MTVRASAQGVKPEEISGLRRLLRPGATRGERSLAIRTLEAYDLLRLPDRRLPRLRHVGQRTLYAVALALWIRFRHDRAE